ncbi:glycosyltransferase [Bizionia myxarmorum]|uniref:Glycosyltransferase n=1 Tax=Bizionia myxarmorum TaxID=291186 RepID=A0A5D0R850_9FLAO|nr:glycosyltransferase [Bizionia myxarmorum]TYB77006.1 glycosyltransferase [Bizionia myxarmorum]
MSKRIRVLYTIPNFNTAGSGKVVYDLVNGLDKSKFDVEIACGNAAGHFFKTIQALEIPIYIIETKTHLKPYASLLFRVLKVSRFFNKQQYDVIHSWQWSSDWTESLAAKLAGVKWLYTKKAMGFDSKHWRIKSYLADFIVTVNTDMVNYFPNKKRQKLIPFGLDTSYYNPELFLNSKDSNVFKIITVANLVAVKNIEIIIEAIHELKDSSIHLDIVGDTKEDYAGYLKKLVEDYGLIEQVFFLGKLPDVRSLLAKASLYIISSKQEGMPMALVEAMCLGIPVLGSDVSGVNFVLKDYKELLFPLEDLDVLVQKIRDIKSMTTFESDKLGMDLRYYCLEHFSKTGFIEEHEQLYSELVEK